MSPVHPELPQSLGRRCENIAFGWIFPTHIYSPWIDHVSAGMSWCDSKGEISYVTAHMQTIRAQPYFKGAAYPRAPLGSSQGKPSAVQTDLCIRDNAASALWAQTPELFSSLWKCLCKGAVPPSVCILVCVIQAIDIQHIQDWERNGERNKGSDATHGKKEKEVRMKWSLKNSRILRRNVRMLDKLQRCWRAKWMKMWRRRWN